MITYQNKYQFKQHNVIDFNNLLYQKFLYMKKFDTFTPEIKV